MESYNNIVNNMFLDQDINIPRNKLGINEQSQINSIGHYDF